MSKLCAVAFVVFLSAVLRAQTTVHGSLAGTISDPQGLAIPNARVSVTSAGTNFRQTRVTDPNGSYFFARLAPGAYRVVVGSDGFRKASYDRVEISVAEAAVLNVCLEVGQSAEAVTVTAAAELVQSQSADISLLMPEKRIKDLPLNGRNFSRLMLLAPGAAGVTANNNSAVSGGRPTNNSFAVDGIGSNDERTQYGFAFGSGSAGTSTDLGATAPNVI
ncbi:MAG TPA: carboxypeptidase-like regulatory domain-containing protein, partial [Bryobacteraceae bacterium]|nr:carboxypeptidase-like regulatory domain-containing protein [Bryobacteraceae bacterium]